MIRLVYAFVLRLHPRAFRQRFAGEMLWIFDQTAGRRAAVALLVDAFLSLLRQWALRPEFRNREVLEQRVLDGIPAFYTSESSMPRPAALVNGLVLSVAAFGTLAFLIAHGKTTGLLKLPRVVILPADIVPDTLGDTSPAAAGFKPRTGGMVVPLKPLPGTASRLSTIGAQGPGGGDSQSGAPDSSPQQPSPGGRSVYRSALQADSAVGQAALLLRSFDKDQDGRISQRERANVQDARLRKLLARADLDNDGVVTREELQEWLRSQGKLPGN